MENLLQASSVIAMKQADIADKQAHERAEWQQHSVGGLVKSVTPRAAQFPSRQRRRHAKKTSP